MNAQDLINDICSCDVPVPILARSMSEYCSSKSKDFLAKVEVLSEAVLYDTVEEVDDLLTATDTMSSVINTINGETYEFKALCETVCQDVDLDSTYLTAKSGTQATVSDILSDINDQYVSIAALTAGFSTVAESAIDETNQTVDLSFSDFADRVSAITGDLDGAQKMMIEGYYETLVEENVPIRDKLQSLISIARGDNVEYNEGNDSPVEFYSMDGTFSGVTPWAAWCAENDISWDNTWSAIKSAFKVVGTAINGIFQAVGSIATSLWHKITEPFTTPDAIIENSSYTTNFFDVPIAQGYVVLDRLWYTSLCTLNGAAVNQGAQMAGISSVDALRDWLIEQNSKGITVFETNFVRIAFWHQDELDGVDYSSRGGVLGYMVNIAPTSYESDPNDGSVILKLPSMKDLDLEGPYYGYNSFHSFFQYYSQFENMQTMDLSSQKALFAGILSALVNIQYLQVALTTGAGGWLDQLNGWDYEYGELLNLQQAGELNTCIEGTCGQKIDPSDNSAITWGRIIQPIDFNAIDNDIVKTSENGPNPSNADFLRVIAYNNVDVKKSTNTISTEAYRGVQLVGSLLYAIFTFPLAGMYVPYRHVKTLGTPRYTLVRDSSKGVLSWLIATGIVATVSTVLGIKFGVRRAKQKKLAKLQGRQWAYTDVIATASPKSQEYKQAVNNLAKTNRKISRVERCLGAVDTSSTVGSAMMFNNISNQLSDSNDQDLSNDLSALTKLIAP